MLHPSIFFWLKQWLQRSVLESRMLSIPLTALPLCPIHPNTSYSRQYFIYTSFIHLFIHSFEEHSKNIPVNQRVVKEQTFYSKNKPICQVVSSDWSDEKIPTTKYVLRVLMFTFNSHLTRAEVYKQTIANRWN